GYGRMAEGFDPTDYDEIWVVLPDASHLAKQFGEQAQLLWNLPKTAPQARFLYLFASPLERRAFRTRVEEKSSRIQFVSDNVVGAQLTMIIGNPRDALRVPEFWILAYSGFQRAANTNPEIMSQHLQECIPALGVPAVEGEIGVAKDGGAGP